MSMTCKQCGESFPKNQPFDLFEFRKHTYLPADTHSTTHSAFLEDGGTFCSRNCLSNYLKASEKSAATELGARRDKLGL